MKRPGWVWVWTIVVALYLVFEVFGSVLVFAGWPTPWSLSDIVRTCIDLLVLFVPFGIAAYNFFMLQLERSILWAHISYGLTVGYTVIEYVLYFAFGMKTIPIASPTYIPIVVIIWWLMVRYIKTAQLDGRPAFA